MGEPSPSSTVHKHGWFGKAVSPSLVGTGTCLGACHYSLHGCMAPLHILLLLAAGCGKGEAEGTHLTHSEMLLFLPWALPGLRSLRCQVLWEPPSTVPAGLSGQDKNGLPREATEDAEC